MTDADSRCNKQPPLAVVAEAGRLLPNKQALSTSARAKPASSNWKCINDQLTLISRTVTHSEMEQIGVIGCSAAFSLAVTNVDTVISQKLGTRALLHRQREVKEEGEREREKEREGAKETERA